MKSLYYRTITPLHKFAVKWHWFLAGAMLCVMFGLGVTSMAGDSAIIDEIAHIPAAYSYLHYGDYRLNPEHPPLIKDLAGVPLQFMDLKFPDTIAPWTTEVNGQWETGWNFLYHIGNDPDKILFWARLPILLLSLAFGVILYCWVVGRWGKATALLTLLFYTMSPNIIAHSRFVTTDLGATVFMFLALIAFVRFIENPRIQNMLLLSLALAGAQLAKFSSVMLYPILLLVTFVVVAAWKRPNGWLERAQLYVGGLVSASVVSVIWIWIYYIPHVIHMPTAVQDRLITGSLVSPELAGFGQSLVTLSHIDFFKPIVQYLLGLGMVYGRVAGGNITYFNGQVTNQSFHMYFPELFVLKTQVAFLILGLIMLGVITRIFLRNRRLPLAQRVGNSVRTHLPGWTLGFFALVYFVISVAGNLNLGIRHILPIYPPLFVMVAICTVHVARRLARSRWRQWSAAGLTILLSWYAGATLWVYPAYLPYFNELIGGPNNAYKYFSDSGVDWGQDLVRLHSFVKEQGIKKIALDYFGGGIPMYYFCTRAYDEHRQLIATGSGYDCSGSEYEFWHSQYGRYTGQYIAVSETFLENDRWYSKERGDDGYAYLRAMKPIAKIGYSIYVYKLY